MKTIYMKKLGLLLTAFFIVHVSFACKLNPPPPCKANPAHCITRTDSVESKCVPREKAAIKDITPEKKKPHYRRIVLILV